MYHACRPGVAANGTATSPAAYQYAVNTGGLSGAVGYGRMVTTGHGSSTVTNSPAISMHPASSSITSGRVAVNRTAQASYGPAGIANATSSSTVGYHAPVPWSDNQANASGAFSAGGAGVR